MTTLLVDGDIVGYRSAAAVQKNGYLISLGNGQQVEVLGKKALDVCLGELANQGVEVLEIEKKVFLEPVENALHIARQTIENMMERLGSKSVKVFLTGKNNFRDTLATILPYKGQREVFLKPKHLQAVREYLISRFNAEVIDGSEADDAMGIAATEPGAIGNTVICSIDKDLNMIPGLHYNWVKDERFEIDEREGWRNFYSQMLQGDDTDNIPGLEGVGPKTAAKILAGSTTPGSMFGTVYREYFNRFGHRYDKDHGLNEALLEIGNLLWIRRHNQPTWEFPT